ncbi:MAG: hypothetical protein RIS86_896 [Planctomycetota bacterium]|jgi:hypothetical protein
MTTSPAILASPRAESSGLVVERLRVWSGLDCDCEWFEVGADEIVRVDPLGCSFRACSTALEAATRTAEMRVRAVFRVERHGALLVVRSRLAAESSVVVRDAFSTELAQASGGSGILRIPLATGRFSVEAFLLPASTLSVADADAGPLPAP